MKLKESYSIKVFDEEWNDKEFLPVIIKSQYPELHKQLIKFIKARNNDKNTYIFDGFAGADRDHTLPIRVIAKKAWQNHFCHNMFIRPNSNELENFKPKADHSKSTICNWCPVWNECHAKSGLPNPSFDNIIKILPPK